MGESSLLPNQKIGRDYRQRFCGRDIVMDRWLERIDSLCEESDVTVTVLSDAPDCYVRAAYYGMSISLISVVEAGYV